MKLIIKNSEWMRGTGKIEGVYGGKLYDPDSECLCVQGLYCRELDMPLHVMEDAVSVHEVHGCFHWDSNQKSNWLVDGYGNQSAEAMKVEKINDNTSTTDEEKIALLTPIFAAHGVEIEYLEEL